MAIRGITVSETGESIQRLGVSTKVSIGQKVKTATGKEHPAKLDHFAFLKKAGTLDWAPDPELTKHYGNACQEFWIILLDDNIENVFRTEYAMWSATEKLCSGDGLAAIRKTKEHPDGTPWEPCGETCPDLIAKRCKPSGDLYFILSDFPQLGSVCRLHTSGRRSVRQIYSGLEQIRQITGGRLTGMRAKLVVRPEKTSFKDKDGNKKSTTIYALSIELSAQDMQKMLDSMTEYSRMFENTRKQLGSGKVIDYVVEEEPETERASDVAGEFYPTENIEPAAPVEILQPSRASAQPVESPKPTNGNGACQQYISQEQRKALFQICVEVGWGNEQVKEILLDKWQVENSAKIPVDKYDEICKFFKREEEAAPYVAKDEDIPW